jgi:teichuronic acid biosynthesis glycosyltransferase TuaH
MTTRARRPMVVWCAGVSWDGLYATDRHLATSLAEHVDVLWVDPPLSVLRLVRERKLAAEARRPRLEQTAPNIYRLTPIVTPLPSRAGVEHVTAAIIKRMVRSAVRRCGHEVAAVVGTSPHSRLSLLPGATRVYYATDDFAAGAHLMGLAESRFREPERERVAEADVLAAVSPEIVGSWETRGRPTFVIPNGCDPSHYVNVDQVPLPEDVDLPQPIAGMVGQLSPRVDLSLLEAVADAGISLLLVGPQQPGWEPARIATLVDRTGVRWVGQKSFADLPSYLRVVDVGLTPYVDDEFNRASFPLKTLEYLSAGRPVVSTPLPAVERLGSESIRTASGPEDFVRMTKEALAERRTSEIVAGRRAFAEQHSWAARASALLEAMGIGSQDTVKEGGR